MSLRGGRYEILGTIAAGGMATVHLARALGAGGFERLVALKTMHPHLAAEDEFVAMFLDEARLAARIRHPNVVATLDVQQDEKGLFLVMEYIEGPSLSRLLKALLKKGARLPIDIGLRIFGEALAGLHAAHELTGPDGDSLHLIHRDVSPHNILVGTDGIARITDFGVARAASRLATTRTRGAKGKLTYMAPEQARAEDLDRRCDIYSAGVVFWELLTLERLVRGDNDLAMLDQITRADRKAPHEVSPEVPPALSAVCMRALERDPARRFPTAAAFAEALEKAASAIGATPASARTVAQFVRDLQVHVSAADVPPSPSRPGPNRAPMASVPSTGAASAPGADSASSSVSSAAGARTSASPESIPAVGATLATSAHAGASATARGPSRVILAIGAGAMLLAGAAGAWFFFLRGSPGAGDMPPSAAISATPVVASSPTSAPVVEPGATVPVPASPPSSSASAAPSASASAKTAPAPPRTAPTGAPRTFRPKEL